MKKVLALVLAFTMVFSSISFAFADTTPVATTVAEISADAQACVTLGMLQGSDQGVTAEYLAGESTRLQAAIMTLRLKGLEKDALAYVGDKNFADMTDFAWAEGKNAVAYLLAHPELGFIGDGVNFMPNQKIDEASYYKVMLTALGYKQTTAEVVGDYAWADVLTFAKSLGLAPQALTTFTNNDIAKITIEALKAKNKDGKVLVNALVAAGTLTNEKAIAAGLIGSAVEGTIKTVKAIGNTVVEVEYTEAVDKAAAENVDNYKVEGLEIKAATLDGTKKVLLETAAQTSGKTYTLVAGDQKVNFGGKAKVTEALELGKVTGTDTEKVELQFNGVLDFATATNVATYTIANVTIEKASLNADRNKVTLTTSGLTSNKTYSVKVTNIKSVDGVTLKSASKSFYAKSDKTAPKIVKAEPMTYTRVLVKFDEELDKETSENVENYTIANLTVEKATLVEDPAEEEDRWVELTTSAQKAGTSYTVKVKGVKDTSVLANEIVREASVKFTGKTQDKTGPTVKTTTVLSRNRLLVEFNDASRLDFTTVENSANYEFNKDITVEKVEILPVYAAYKNDTKKAIVTVSDMAEKTTYKLTIIGVTDEYANEMTKAEKSINYNNASLDAAKIKSVNSTSGTKAVITFDKHIDPVTAKDVANYSINGGLGTPIQAKINDDLNKVTLTVNEQVEGKSYKVTVKGVMDLAGNTLNSTASFVGLTTENDIEAPEVEDITVVNRRVMRVTFTEAINVNSAAVAKLSAGNDLSLSAVYDDNTVLEFSRAANFQDIEYTLKSFTGVADKAGNNVVVDSDGITFWGDNSEEENIDFSWEQINVEKYKLTFSEKVEPKAGVTNTYVDDDSDDLGMDTVWYLKKKVAIDKDAFNNDINTQFASRHGISINNTEEDVAGKTKITASMEDDEIPYIESVEAVNRYKVKVTFSEDIKTYGTYTISYYDLAGKEKKVQGIIGAVDLDNDNVALLDLTKKLALESRFDYTLKITSQVQDLAGNKTEKDETYDFQGTDLVAPSNYITGVEIINGTTFKVRLNEKIFGNKDEDVNASPVDLTETNPATLKLGTANVVVTTANNMSATAKTSNVFTVSLVNDTLQSDKTYVVTLGGMSYTFAGTVESGLSVEQTNQNLVIAYSDLKATDVVRVVYGQVDATLKTVSKGFVNITPGTDDAQYTLAPNKVLFNVSVKRGLVTLYTFEHEENNQAAADVVIGLINNITNVTTKNAARAQYDNLTVIQQSLVTNYSTLASAESLGAAIADASDLAINTPVDDVNPTAGTVTTAAKTALTNAITAATTVNTNGASTLEQLETAKTPLAAAVATFEAAIR